MLPNRFRHARRSAMQDIDITPFMNLMAVLTPFLLATAVFTRLAVLEIYLPPPSDVPQEDIQMPDTEELVLTISITDRGMIVANAENIVAFIQSTNGEQDFEALGRILLQLKARYPEEDSAIILSTAMIPYGMVVSAMDSTQTFLDRENGVRRQLFPNVSLGEVR
jgi:biopolymer transport protein ExbD